jgi:hypothetical protein
MNGSELKDVFDLRWGGFRKFIAANPLSGFWYGVAAGVIGGALLRGLL